MSSNSPLVQIEHKRTLAKDIISFCALILGSILISIGSFLAWGVPIGLVVLGVLFLLVSLVFGYNK